MTIRIRKPQNFIYSNPIKVCPFLFPLIFWTKTWFLWLKFRICIFNAIFLALFSNWFQIITFQINLWKYLITTKRRLMIEIIDNMINLHLFRCTYLCISHDSYNHYFHMLHSYPLNLIILLFYSIIIIDFYIIHIYQRYNIFISNTNKNKNLIKFSVN